MTSHTLHTLGAPYLLARTTDGLCCSYSTNRQCCLLTPRTKTGRNRTPPFNVAPFVLAPFFDAGSVVSERRSGAQARSSVPHLPTSSSAQPQQRFSSRHRHVSVQQQQRMTSDMRSALLTVCVHPSSTTKCSLINVRT